MDLIDNKYVLNIDISNIDKLLYVLDSILDRRAEERIKILTVVVGIVSGALGNSIIEHYDIETKSEVIKELVDFNQIEKEFVEGVVNEIKSHFDFVLGGSGFTERLLDGLDEQSKKMITQTMQRHYPQKSSKVRDIIVFFEDLFDLSDADISKVVAQLPVNLLAIALCSAQDEQRNKIYQLVSEGMQAMIEQVIEYRADSISNLELKDAHREVIATIIELNKRGQINLKKSEKKE